MTWNNSFGCALIACQMAPFCWSGSSWTTSSTNTSVSCIRSRMYSAYRPKTPPTTNGMRQPNEVIAVEANAVERMAASSVPASCPIVPEK